MGEYYFLASLLPPLEIGHIPSISFVELKELLKLNVTKSDLEKVKKFLLLIDMENLRALWSNEPHDPRGNYSRDELIESLVDFAWPDGTEFPPYLRDFLEKYQDNRDRIVHFSLLMSRFLVEEQEDEEGFLADYFAFERDFRLVMVGFRAKKLGKDVTAELQFEDPTEPIVAEILAQKDAPNFEPPFEFKELKPIFLSYADFPLELHKALLAYSFDKVQELYGNKTFSIDRILGFMARLLMVERWLELDVQEGINMIGRIEEKIE